MQIIVGGRGLPALALDKCHVRRPDFEFRFRSEGDLDADEPLAFRPLPEQVCEALLNAIVPVTPAR